jgi:CDP-diglyceride synthetase
VDDRPRDDRDEQLYTARGDAGPPDEPRFGAESDVSETGETNVREPLDDPELPWPRPGDPWSAELPHWTDAPTGEVPAVLGGDAPDVGGDADPWASLPPPTWREGQSDWEAQGSFEHSIFADESPLGALDDSEERDEPWHFDIDPPVERTSPGATPSPPAPVRGGTTAYPGGGYRDTSPAATGEDVPYHVDEPTATFPAVGAVPVDDLGNRPGSEPERVGEYQDEELTGAGYEERAGTYREATARTPYGETAGSPHDEPTGSRYDEPIGSLYDEPTGSRYEEPIGSVYDEPVTSPYDEPAPAPHTEAGRFLDDATSTSHREEPPIVSTGAGAVTVEPFDLAAEPTNAGTESWAPASPGQELYDAEAEWSAGVGEPGVPRGAGGAPPMVADSVGVEESTFQAEPSVRVAQPEGGELVGTAASASAATPGGPLSAPPQRGGPGRQRRRPGPSQTSTISRRHTGPPPDDGGPPSRNGYGEARQERETRSGRNLPLAIGSGLAIGILAIIFLSLGNAPTLFFVTVVLGLAAVEGFAAFRLAGYRPATLLGLVAVVGLVVATYFKGQEAEPLVLVLLVVFCLLWYLTGVERADPVSSTAVTVLVFGWVGVFGSYAALLLNPRLFPDRHGLAYLLGAIIAAVAYDVGALVVGAWVGRRPLAPSTSPHKTWEGLIGGAVAAIIVSVIVVHAIHPWTAGKALALGIVVAVVAPIGDLCESLLKRHLGLKDMGRFLPGHGGLLDRLDALLFVMPATYYLVKALHLG